MNEELYCNARQCHRPLNNIAWVTFCSHIFCEDHGTAYLGQLPCTCPACGAALASKEDILRVDLDPSEQFRNMILAGLKPDIIMDVCTRALNFWSYQMDKERQRQIGKVEQLKSQMMELEEYYEKILRDTNAELAATSRQLDNARKEYDIVSEQKVAISSKLGEKSRQYQKLKALYDSQRRRSNAQPGCYDSGSSVWKGKESVGRSQNALVPYQQQQLHPCQPLVANPRFVVPAHPTFFVGQQLAPVPQQNSQPLESTVHCNNTFPIYPKPSVSHIYNGFCGVQTNNMPQLLQNLPYPEPEARRSLVPSTSATELPLSNQVQQNTVAAGSSLVAIPAYFPTSSEFRFDPKSGRTSSK